MPEQRKDRHNGKIKELPERNMWNCLPDIWIHQLKAPEFLLKFSLQIFDRGILQASLASRIKFELIGILDDEDRFLFIPELPSRSWRCKA